MKKLLIVATAALSAVAVHAATANWSATARGIYDGTGSTDATYSGAAYFFDASKMAQSALYALIAADVSGLSATAATGYVATGTVTSGSLPNTTKFDYGDQSASATDLNSYSFYFVIVKDDTVYFSNIKEVSANATATAKSIAFGGQTNSSLAPTTVGYAGDGAWSSVPEPTSGILLALGLCGLALRRKRA